MNIQPTKCFSRQTLRTCLLMIGTLGIILLVASCATAPQQEKKAGKWVWPQPPEQPVIKYLRTIWSEEELESSKKISWKDALIGEEGKGFRYALATLDHSRLGIAAQAVGIAQAAMDEALRYGMNREQFGKPIIHHQAIAFRLAEMDTELAAARALLYQAAWAGTQPGRHSRQSARAKLYASEMCNRVVEWAVQVHGGYGYSREYTVERLYRDARVTTIYEGSSEVQKMVIARHLQDVAKNL